MSVSVCLVCVRKHFFALHVQSLPDFCACHLDGRGSVLLRRHSDVLRISGFTDDVIFAIS